MSQISISYKRKDELRVSRLIKALKSAGRTIWWDRGLAGGKSWRNQIQNALDAAKCVIVELEQIQFLLGHVSVQTTEGYLGSEQPH
jgi:hypothetical protein